MTTQEQPQQVWIDEPNRISQRQLDYWSIVDVLDSGIPTEAIKSLGKHITFENNIRHEIKIEDMAAPDWKCRDCKQIGSKICLCDMELRCMNHMNKHCLDQVKIVVNDF